MEGPATTDQQVIGVADPTALDAAVPLDAERSALMSTAPATGTQILVAELNPVPTAYTAGMVITVVPDAAHEAGALLSLNGLPPQALVTRDGSPILTGDLPIGVPCRLAYDGDRFVVLGSSARTCPAGFSASTSGVCIADSSAAPRNFFEANLYCRQQQARLCSFGEWVAACQSVPGFFATVPSGEWVDSAANLNQTAKTAGHGQDGFNVPPGAGCTYGGYDEAATGSYRVRCCKDR